MVYSLILVLIFNKQLIRCSQYSNRVVNHTVKTIEIRNQTIFKMLLHISSLISQVRFHISHVYPKKLDVISLISGLCSKHTKYCVQNTKNYWISDLFVELDRACNGIPATEYQKKMIPLVTHKQLFADVIYQTPNIILLVLPFPRNKSSNVARVVSTPNELKTDNFWFINTINMIFGPTNLKYFPSKF